MVTLAEWRANQEAGQTTGQQSRGQMLRTMAASNAIGMSLRGGSFADIAEEAGILAPEAYESLRQYAPPEFIQQARATGQNDPLDMAAGILGGSGYSSPFEVGATPNLPGMEMNRALAGEFGSGPAYLNAGLNIITSPPVQRAGAAFDLLSQAIPTPISPLPYVPFSREALDISRNYRIPEVRTEGGLTYGTTRRPTFREGWTEYLRRIRAEYDVAVHGAQWDPQSALSYVNVLDREMNGPGGPVFNVAKWVGGIGADIFTDPLLLVGPAARLGTEGRLLREANSIMDSIGLVGSNRNVATLKSINRNLRATGIAGDRLKFLQDVERRFGTLDMPGLTGQVQRGYRGLIQLPRFSRIAFPSMWNADSSTFMRTLGRPLGIESIEMVPIGGRNRVFEASAKWLESKGVSDGWTLMDMMFPSDITKQIARRMADTEIKAATPTATNYPLPPRAQRLATQIGAEITKEYYPLARPLAAKTKQTLERYGELASREWQSAELEAQRMGVYDLRQLNTISEERATFIESSNGVRIGKGGYKASDHAELVESIKAELTQAINNQIELRELNIKPGAPESLVNVLEDSSGIRLQPELNNPASRENLRNQGYEFGYKSIEDPYAKSVGGQVAPNPNKQPGRYGESEARRRWHYDRISLLRRNLEAAGLYETPATKAVLGSPKNIREEFMRFRDEIKRLEELHTKNNIAVPQSPRYQRPPVLPPPPPTRRELVVTAVPLNYTKNPPPMPEHFNTPEIAEWISDIQSRQKGYLEISAQGGLKNKKLTQTEGTIFDETRAAFEDLQSRRKLGTSDENLYYQEAAEYLRHHVSSEAWDILKRPEIGVVSVDRNGHAAVSPKFLDTWSQTMATRANRQGITQFNQKVWDEGFGQIPAHTVRNFFETNPAKREPARYLEAVRRRAAGNYYKSISNHLMKYPQFIIPQSGEIPKGFKALIDFLPDRTVASMDDILRARVGQIMLPDSPGIRTMIERQSAILSSPEHLEGFMRFLQNASNWWKVNTLGIFPAYHLGNMVSNMYLLYLGGMWDPSMLALAWKISKNPESLETVGSKWSGQSYTYKQLAEQMHAWDVNRGFYRGQIEQAVESAGDPLGMKSYRNQEGKFDTLGMLKMVTGMDWRIEKEAGETFIDSIIKFPRDITKRLPGGEEFIGNRIGFLLSSNIEGNARSAMFLHALINEGSDFKTAASRVAETMFDYAKTGIPQSKAMKGVEQVMEGLHLAEPGTGRQTLSTLVPFYEFNLGNAMAHATATLNTPGRVSVPYRLLAQMTRPTDEKTVPPWDRDALLFKLGGSDVALDLSRYIPAAQALQGLGAFAPANVIPGEKENLFNYNPLISLALAEFSSYIDPFTGKKLEDYPGEKRMVKIFGQDVEINARMHYALTNLFRAYREASRGDLARFMGVRLVKEDYPTQLYYDRRTTQGNLETELRGMAEADHTPGEIERLRQAAITNQANLIMNYAETYTINDQGKELGPFRPFTTGTNTDESRYHLLNQITDRITARSTEGGIIATINESTSFTPEQKAAYTQAWWRAWFEIEQTKLAYLGAYIGTIPRTGIYAEEGKGPGANAAYQEQLEDAYTTMRNEIQHAVEQPSIGPLTFGAFRNAYADLIEHQSWDRIRTRGGQGRASWIRSAMDSFDERNNALYEQLRAIEREGNTQE